MFKRHNRVVDRQQTSKRHNRVFNRQQTPKQIVTIVLSNADRRKSVKHFLRLNLRSVRHRLGSYDFQTPPIHCRVALANYLYIYT